MRVSATRLRERMDGWMDGWTNGRAATSDLQVEWQAGSQGPVVLREVLVVRQQQDVHDAEQQLLGLGGGQQGAPVLHHEA